MKKKVANFIIKLLAGIIVINITFSTNNVFAMEEFIETVTFGVPTFTLDNYQNLSNDYTIAGLLTKSRDHLKENHRQLNKNGVIYRGYHTLSNKYGDQQDVFTYVLYYSPETINRINFDNWNPKSEKIPEVADGFYLHPVFSDTKYYSMQNYENEELPQGFLGVINGTHVNENTIGDSPEKYSKALASVPDKNNKSVDKVYGPIDPTNKTLINPDLGFYEYKDGDKKVYFTILGDEIFTVTVIKDDPMIYTDENVQSMLKEIQKFMADDAELVGIDEYDYRIEYTFESVETGHKYSAEISPFENEFFSISVGQYFE